MLGVSPIFGWPYPYWNEPVNTTDIQNIATAIDTSWGTFNTRNTASRAASKFQALGPLVTSPAINTETAPLTFSVVNYNSVGWAFAGTTTLTVPAGVYNVSLGISGISNTNLVANIRCTINVGGTPVLRAKHNMNLNGAGPCNAAVYGELFLTAASALTCTMLWNGNAGAPTFARSFMVQQVRATLP